MQTKLKKKGKGRWGYKGLEEGLFKQATIGVPPVPVRHTLLLSADTMFNQQIHPLGGIRGTRCSQAQQCRNRPWNGTNVLAPA